ncbi:MAG: MopE-related protein, partial [Myxococcota bacterium]|nr:MopE-related protein [Myxococcota bacterium]
PIMPEICNEIDDDCNNQIDDNPSNGVTWYADSDQDNFGDPFVTLEACTQPNGYTTNQQDCNDNDASINPAAQELCDEIDNNCDPSDDQTPDLSDLWYADNDGDGFGDPFNNQAACEQPDGYVSNSDDCNDGDVSINPSAAEICNGSDENCNGQIDENSTTTTPWYADADGDGFGDPNSTSNECIAPNGYISDNTDCNDNESAINPDATEICDNIDNNCNNLIDTDDSGLDITSQRPYYLDSDADGFGDLNSPLISCSQPNGHSSNSDDCDDTNPNINPDADEVCDGKDNNCSGTVDVNPTDAALWFEDADGDGFAGSESIRACDQPDGYFVDSTDCDDANAFVNPSAQEICNGIDDDCNDQVDDGATAVDWFADADGDGFGNASDTINTCTPPDGYVLEAGDCNDQNAQVNPGAEEICDGKDNNCDSLVDDDDPTLNNTDGGTFYADTDTDGFGDPSSAISVCFPPSGFVSDNTDCDDNNPSINPGATEVCDGKDNNCDSNVDSNAIDASVWYADSDGDGFAGDLDTVLACDQPSDYFPSNLDCDDSNATINPSAPENCNGIDDNCNGQIDDDPVSLGSWYKDVDEDGFGDPDTVEESCEQPDGYVLLDTDCDDSDPDINPDALEICDGVDNDCDEDIDDEDTSLSGSLTEWFRDGDGDGFGDANNRSQSCEVPNGYTEDSSDCDDQNPQINPDAEEICDGIDNNCDSNIDADATDAVEWFADQDGDGFAGGNTTLSCTQPPNHYLSEEDCDDSNPATNPDALEICDGEDNDCNGQIDDNATNLTTFYRDVDRDGYGDLTSPVDACASENGFVENGEDCNDQNANVNPDGLEVCDSQDNDCDGLVDDDDPDVDESTQGLYGLDLDGDGYGDANDTIRSCSQPNNYASNVLDCDDTQATINPGETEVCDGIDQDCDGQLDSEASCPCNFYTFEDSSYYFCEQSLRWPWAEFVCQFTNYELVAINSQAENDFVYATAMTISTNQWWTGLNDRALEDDFVWSNGDPLTYENWEAAEPNDSGGEDCMSLNQFGDDLWNDNRCSNSYYFVCETNP